MKPFPLPARLLALLAILPLAGCGTPTLGLSNGGALAAFKPIEASPADTCTTQKAVAEHNSRYDSIKNGKPTVYKAPCEVDKKQSVEPATS